MMSPTTVKHTIGANWGVRWIISFAEFANNKQVFPKKDTLLNPMMKFGANQ